MPSVDPTRLFADTGGWHGGHAGSSASSTSSEEFMRSVPDLTGQIVREHDYADEGGGFADVYKATWHSEKVAVKVLRSHSTEPNDLQKRKKRLRREIRVWQRLSHRNILPLYGVSNDFGPFPSMVCPWVEQGNLNKYLERHHETLTPSDRFRFICEIADGLNYLHSCDVVHGDLTGSNILINSQGKALLCDFGLSKIMAEFEGTTYFTSTRGAIRWAARELYRIQGEDDDYTPVIDMKCDIFSLGSVMLQVLSGRVPYYYITNDIRVIVELYNGIKPRRPKHAWITDSIWKFINRCWGESEQRPSARSALNYVHKYHSHLKRSLGEMPAASGATESSPRTQSPNGSEEVPMIGAAVSMKGLRAEQNDRSVIEQIDWLIYNNIDYIRHTSGDGDCFYRSIGFAMIEQLLHSQNTAASVERKITVLRSTRHLLELADFDPSIYNDLLEIFTSIVQQIIVPDAQGQVLTDSILLEAFQTPEVSNSVVLYLRLLTSAQIRADPEFYAHFLFEFDMQPIAFCSTNVEELGVDAGDIQIAALSRALGLNVHIYRLDGRPKIQKVMDFTEFNPSKSSKLSKPIVLLRRPGHYEPLYSTSNKT